ncbi:Hypothetical protein PHPALM_18358 [Phytophthora palmivora]|uniref:Reverse transcriptase n=1 Tax=Phytophthora palmivora TaxID=4796 RepID=A0A2P4XJX2_9STRA|nr:Hypothetical protein PHPALM_18358 [Phytophthora palmivora]
MWVIACKKETLQVELARHKELTKNLNSVRRVRFKDDENKATNKPVPANEEDSTQPEATEPDLNSELEIRRRQPARRIETSGEAEFGDTQPSSQGDEAELDASRAPSADNIDPVVVQAERRRRIDIAQDEVLRWADLKAYLRGELSQLSFRRVRNAGKVADDFVLSEDGLLYRHNRSRRRGGDDEPNHFTGFVIAKAMAETGALEAAKVFEESVFQRFGAPSLVRHDRDPRFMSEVFQKFSEMMQSSREDGICNKQLKRLNSAGNPILPGTWLGCAINDEGYDGVSQARPK